MEYKLKQVVQSYQENAAEEETAQTSVRILTKETRGRPRD